MPSIKFMHNWNNKLDCDYFTTIRGYSLEKHKYYCSLIEKPLEVLLKNQHYKNAVLKNVYVEVYQNINPIVLTMDVGYDEISKQADIFGKFGIKDDSLVLILLLGKE